MTILRSGERCEKMVWGESGYQTYQCKRRSVNAEDGKRWCRQHTPSIVKAKADAKMQEYQDARNRYDSLRSARDELLASVLKAKPDSLSRRVNAAVKAYKNAHKRARV